METDSGNFRLSTFEATQSSMFVSLTKFWILLRKRLKIHKISVVVVVAVAVAVAAVVVEVVEATLTAVVEVAPLAPKIEAIIKALGPEVPIERALAAVDPANEEAAVVSSRVINSSIARNEIKSNVSRLIL